MRCRTCDYLLWNLRSRICPECGSGFRPSEFEFAPSSVQFCCPHCNQSYYGTGEKGRIVPRAFDCVTCEQRIDLDEMVLLPSVGLEEHQTRAERVPWLERRRLGVVKAWFSTVRGSMTHPTRMIRGAPGEGKSFQAWRFSINTIALSAIIGHAEEPVARAYEACAEELEESWREWELEALTLEEAAEQSGYSRSHLKRLLREQAIPNSGNAGEKRILRSHLPKKPGQGVAPPVRSCPITRTQVARAIAEGGEI